MSSRLTIEEFASKVGVSTATVSRAMHGRGRISEKTRQTILSQMVEYGYVPNRNAQQLANGRAQSVLIHHSSVEIMSDQFSIEVTRGIQHSLANYGYSLCLDIPVPSGQIIPALQRTVQSQAVAGTVVLEGSGIPDNVIDSIASRNHPVVVVSVGGGHVAPNLASVWLQESPGINAIAKHLIDKGHRRIGVINWLDDDGVQSKFLDALASHGVRVPENYIASGPAGVDSAGEEPFRRLMSQATPPTAIFVRKDELVIGALREARRSGLRLPQDVSIAGFDDFALTRLADPRLTAVGLNCQKLGERCAEALVSMLRQPDLVIEQILHPTELVVRESVADINPR
jgi:DNA-binding LacI/PurR family transcriptional regulator